ncbi:uncharacterized protein M421DRAFT_4922 [Didymella exigua CBS 183.55]|uniref:Uncharacterized protein n=1 Tax=Didymella exigua CBS 183.55 TaxID=1150837 RepID=A0A6A5RPN7_9PLEO|nr:uncharacterized protein M421DRAFT_4922 [Didymella exigua CBS 183.55]KAF1929118.1 hypothetical protein M421DRAFT_4922 [Didymella exigua CBS 183.55]
MTLDNEIRTAQAVQYRKLLGIPIVTTQRCPKNGADPVTGRSVSARDPELRKYDTAYPNIGIYDGRATYLSCLQRGDDMDIAQRVVDWDRKYPRVGNELAATDKYPARNVRPWERSTSSIEAPAVHPLWYQVTPSPTPDALKLPPKSPLPQSQHTGERIGSRPPIQKLRQLNLRSATGSLSPRPTCEVLDDQFTSRKAEKTDTRKHSLVSYLTEGFLRDEIARNLAQADYIRNQNEKREVDERKERRRKEQEKEKAKQERAMAVKKKRLEDVPAYIKDLARNWRERYPGPDKLFRKDFDFGPKTQGDDDDDYCRPLSPHSSCHSLSKAFTNTHSKSLKRQRHDSSNPDVARESPHDRYSTMSSPIPMQRSQPTTPISRSFSSGVGAPEAHPGQLVDFTLHSSPRFEVDYSNKDRILFLTSKYDRNHVLDYFETRAWLTETVAALWTLDTTSKQSSTNRVISRITLRKPKQQ